MNPSHAPSSSIRHRHEEHQAEHQYKETGTKTSHDAVADNEEDEDESVVFRMLSAHVGRQDKKISSRSKRRYEEDREEELDEDRRPVKRARVAVESDDDHGTPQQQVSPPPSPPLEPRVVKIVKFPSPPKVSSSKVREINLHKVKMKKCSRFQYEKVGHRGKAEEYMPESELPMWVSLSYVLFFL